MKKVFIFALCILLVCALSVPVFATEAEFEDIPTEAEKIEIEETSEKMVEDIVTWVQTHTEEITVVLTLFFSIILMFRKITSVLRALGVLNNNTITVANDSAQTTNAVLAGVGNVAAELSTIKNDVNASLGSIVTYMDTAKRANIELANEVAELLVLANIPNAKKEELYARHRAAVDAINGIGNTEVIGNVEEA